MFVFYGFKCFYRLAFAGVWLAHLLRLGLTLEGESLIICNKKFFFFVGIFGSMGRVNFVGAAD